MITTVGEKKSESPPSPRPEMDRAVAELQGAKEAWATLPIGRKIDYARGLIEGTLKVAPRQVEAAGRAKGIDPDSPRIGEEWLGGPYAQIRTLRLLIESLEQIERRGKVVIPRSKIRTRSNGRVAVEVFPSGLIDQLMYMGFRAEVWMQEEVREDNLEDNVAAFYRDPSPKGKVALVLGAGNVASIAALDAVQKLFAEGQVVLIKFNPVNDYLGPFYEEIFRELIADGFVRLAYGGGDVGAYLTAHEGIDEIHITGSDRTHDAIVFGPGEEGAARKARGERLLKKRITSELGNVSPIIVVPGTWSDGDLQFHAENIATQMTQNGGFNCNATKVLVTYQSWPQREAFLNRLRQVLAALPPRVAYYPGAEDRFRRFVDAYPQAEEHGQAGDGALPAALIPEVRPDDALVFREESFCSLAAETRLPGRDAEEFLANAVEFCNERLQGTLNAGIIVDPRTEKALGPALDQAIADLRYGSVAINHWPAIAYALGTTTWGAYPGHTAEDIQSGTGWVHNARLFDKPEKSVAWGPFRVFPKPPWFVTHRRSNEVAERITRLEADPGLLKLPMIVLNAALG